MRSAVLARDDIDARTTPVRAIEAATDGLFNSMNGNGVTVRCVDVEVTSFQPVYRSDFDTSATFIDLNVATTVRRRHVSGMTAIYRSDFETSAIFNLRPAQQSGMTAIIGGGSNFLTPTYGVFSTSWGGNSSSFAYMGTGNGCMQSPLPPSGNLEDLPVLIFNSPDLTATIEQIRETLESGKVDAEDLAAATRAVDEAIIFLRRNRLPGRPRVMMSDDGVLTLQWRSETMGAALIFTGDGTVSVALKNAETSYSKSLEGIALDAWVPAAFVSIVEDIVG